jgi:DMATS type aromatic prenyltransferase
MPTIYSLGSETQPHTKIVPNRCLTRRDVEFWCHHLDPLLHQMLLFAGYDSSSIDKQRGLFSSAMAPCLGKRPSRSGPQWNSFMTDDGTPMETSWSWTETESLPTVRYSIEPIGRGARTQGGAANLRSGDELIRLAQASCRTVNIEWFNVLRQALIARRPTRPNSNSQEFVLFVGFDLIGPDTVLKAYFFPEAAARELSCSKIDLVSNAIASLSSDPAMSSAYERFCEYMQKSPLAEPDPEVEMLAIDCVHPATSRIKVYTRSQRTSLSGVLDALTLGGALRTREFESAVPSFEKLWQAVLSLDASIPPSQSLPVKKHRTAGMLYYYEFKPGSSAIKVKIYIPVRHYGVNDREIAMGLSRFLESQNMHLQGADYADAVQKLW